jgi:hypothetical protein
MFLTPIDAAKQVGVMAICSDPAVSMDRALANVVRDTMLRRSPARHDRRQ